MSTFTEIIGTLMDDDSTANNGVSSKERDVFVCQKRQSSIGVGAGLLEEGRLTGDLH